MQISDAELREDVNVLNVVNFGGGSYVLYAEIDDGGEIEVDPEPYSDNFARPARLLPVEAKALIAAIDLIGEHLPEGSLASSRKKIVDALGADPMDQGLHVADRRRRRLARRALASDGDRRAPRCCELDYYKPNEDEFSARVVEPYALVNGREGWYVACYRPRPRGRAPLPAGPHPPRGGHRRRRSSRAPRSTPPPTSTAGCAPARSRRRASRTSGSRPSALAGHGRSAACTRSSPTASVIVELAYKGIDFLVRDVLAEAGDAAVLDPRDARDAVLAAVGAFARTRVALTHRARIRHIRPD